MAKNAMWVLLTVTVSFWVGVMFARIFPDWNIEWLKLLVETAVAIGTIGAVLVALQQGGSARLESRSRGYRDAAIEHLETAVNNFLGNAFANKQPINTRRHWLNFARAIGVSQQLANRIESEEQRVIWRAQEHVWREKVYDILQPMGDSFSVRYREPSLTPGADGLPLAEQSLVAVYGWVKWPSDLPDPLPRKYFTDAQRDEMRSFGPRGLAEFIDIIRPSGSQQIEAEG